MRGSGGRGPLCHHQMSSSKEKHSYAYCLDLERGICSDIIDCLCQDRSGVPHHLTPSFSSPHPPPPPTPPHPLTAYRSGVDSAAFVSGDDTVLPGHETQMEAEGASSSQTPLLLPELPASGSCTRAGGEYGAAIVRG